MTEQQQTDRQATTRLKLKLTNVTISAPEPGELAEFYQRLLGGEITTRESDWVVLKGPEFDLPLAFHIERIHEPPTWPAEAGKQQQQMHLDIRVEDLDAACEHAVSCGATLAAFQPQDDVRVFLDPVGHPFCLYV